MTEVESNVRKPVFQFRITSFLWLMFAMAAFVAGIQYQKHMVSIEFTPMSPIALVGEFDLDGDGVDDIDKLQRMILRNGGSVIAYDHGNGRGFGKLDDRTFLVVGELEESDTVDIPLLLEATRLGTKQISIQELLANLGVGSASKKARRNMDGHLIDD